MALGWQAYSFAPVLLNTSDPLTDFRAILARLKEHLLPQEDDSLPEFRTSEPNLAPAVKIKRWLEKLPRGQHIELPTDDLDGISHSLEEDPEDIAPQDLCKYRNLVKASPAHTWFVARLERCFVLSRANVDRIPDISDVILSTLSREPSFQRFSRHRNPHLCAMTFRVHWDPLAFLRDQEYDDDMLPEDALERAITITGAETDAQAMTTYQYMSQAWPVMGPDILSLMKDLVRAGYRTLCSRK
jgi:hypothetical protein